MHRKSIGALAAIAVAASSISTPALAQKFAEPVIEPEIIIEETRAKSDDWVVPFMLLVVIAAVLASNGGNNAVSDARLKADITPTGRTNDGIPLYQFRYIGASERFEGVMAQDVLARVPAAVIEMPGGYMAVDYGMLGLELKRLD